MSTPQTVQSISNQVLEALTQPKLTDNDKAKIIADGFAQVEKHYLNLDTLATKLDLRKTELKLTKEIKSLDVKLTKEIEAIRLETKNLEVKLTKEIEVVKKEIEAIRLETKNLEVKLIREISESSKTTIKWMVGLVIAIMIPIMIPIISLVLMK